MATGRRPAVLWIRVSLRGHGDRPEARRYRGPLTSATQDSALWTQHSALTSQDPALTGIRLLFAASQARKF